MFEKLHAVQQKIDKHKLPLYCYCSVLLVKAFLPKGHNRIKKIVIKENNLPGCLEFLGLGLTSGATKVNTANQKM